MTGRWIEVGGVVVVRVDVGIVGVVVGIGFEGVVGVEVEIGGKMVESSLIVVLVVFVAFGGSVAMKWR